MKMKSIKIMLAGLLAVPVILLGMGTAQIAFAEDNLTTGALAAKPDGAKTCLFKNSSCTSGIFTDIVNIALFLIGAISVIMIIYGGIRYTISGGEAKNVTAAKDTIMYAVVGLVVAILAYAIVNFVIVHLI
jgi:drug/metabolite transporter (DMT)-like permease